MMAQPRNGCKRLFKRQIEGAARVAGMRGGSARWRTCRTRQAASLKFEAKRFIADKLNERGLAGGGGGWCYAAREKARRLTLARE
jgi:hypothetical protein